MKILEIKSRYTLPFKRLPVRLMFLKEVSYAHHIYLIKNYGKNFNYYNLKSLISIILNF